MKKRIFLLVSLLVIPVCKAADVDNTVDLRIVLATVKEAAKKGEWQKIYTLIDKGNLNPNQFELYVAIVDNFNNNLEVIEQLLAKGINLNELAEWTTTQPIDKMKPLVKFLIDHGANYDPKRLQQLLRYSDPKDRQSFLRFIEEYIPAHSKNVKDQK